MTPRDPASVGEPRAFGFDRSSMRDGTFSVDGAAVGPKGRPPGRSDGLAQGLSVRWRGSDDRAVMLSGIRQGSRSPGRGRGFVRAVSFWLAAMDGAVASPSGVAPYPSGREMSRPSGRTLDDWADPVPAPIVRPRRQARSSDVVCVRAGAIRTSRLSADTVDRDAFGHGGWLFGRRSIGSGTLRNAAPSGAAGRGPAGTSRGVVVGGFRSPSGKQHPRRAADDPERRRREAVASWTRCWRVWGARPAPGVSGVSLAGHDARASARAPRRPNYLHHLAGRANSRN